MGEKPSPLLHIIGFPYLAHASQKAEICQNEFVGKTTGRQKAFLLGRSLAYTQVTYSGRTDARTGYRDSTSRLLVLIEGISLLVFEAHNQTIQMDNNNLLKQLLMLGIGTTSLVAEKMREVSDEWVRTGKLDPEQASAFVNDLMQHLKSEQSNFEGQMQRQLRNMLQDLGVPRQNEMDELRGRLDRLERQIRDIENRLWR